MKYRYTFSIWPYEDRGFTPSLFDVFRLLAPRLEITFTKKDFESFRALLSRDGFTLRAITRVPHQDAEVII